MIKHPVNENEDLNDLKQVTQSAENGMRTYKFNWGTDIHDDRTFCGFRGHRFRMSDKAKLLHCVWAVLW